MRSASQGAPPVIRGLRQVGPVRCSDTDATERPADAHARAGRRGGPLGWTRSAWRLVPLLAAGICVAAAARADDFVEIQTSKVWVRKGGLACGSADDAMEGSTGFFSSCIRLPIAMQVKLIDTPEPMAQVYHMRVLDAGEKPMNAWFSRDSLTNNPRPADFVADP